MKNKILSKTGEWTFELINDYEKAIGEIARSYQLDTYPIQIEVITSEQMIDFYSSIGMPIGYHHWSLGKQFIQLEEQYLKGHMGLAYEMVINSNPCIAYLLEENTMVMQAIVIAHACYGHNSFFKNNYLFKTWSNANSIIDYLVFSKNYVAKCEQKYGVDAVEDILDACHALMNYGVDRYRHPPKLSVIKEERRLKQREEYLQSLVNELWSTIPKKEKNKDEKEIIFPSEPQENLLYFIEKHAPLLEPWQREIVRIVRKIAQYFYPQRQTKVMNEGWACFWHYHLINDLYDQNLVSDEFMLEFIKAHTNVIYQPAFDDPLFRGINPYTLGFNIFMDIKRICENPTEEDKKWFPDLVNKPWLSSIDFAMRNFKDESFIAQYLSPKLIRDMRLFCLLDDDEKSELEIAAIHDESGYQKIREALSNQHNLSMIEPNIQVRHVDVRGDRSLTLRHVLQNRMTLHDHDAREVMRYLHRLWGFKVKLETEDQQGNITLAYQYPV